MSDMTMVERVARALCADNWRGVPDAPDQVVPIGYGPPQPWGPRWKLYEERARVAIGAMREPTEAMIDAGVNSEHTLEAILGRPYSDSCQNIWEDMIDAALSEKQP